jgi:hypothetical protein
LQAIGAHEPLDRAARDLSAFDLDQVVPHLAGPIDAPADLAVTVRTADLYEPLGVADRARRRRAGLGSAIGVRGDPHAVLSHDAADRLVPEPVAVFVDEVDYQGSRGSSSRAKKLDAASRISFARLSSLFSWRSFLSSSASDVVTPRRATRVDVGLLAPRPQRVGHDPHLGGDLVHRCVQRQVGLLIAGFAHEPDRPVPQLLRVLPRCWHLSTFPWNQSRHQPRGASVEVVRLDGVLE